MKALFQELVYQDLITVDGWDSNAEPIPHFTHKATTQLLISILHSKHGSALFEEALCTTSDELKDYFLTALENGDHAIVGLGYAVMSYTVATMIETAMFDQCPKRELQAMLSERHEKERNEYISTLDNGEEPWDLEKRNA